MTVHDLMADSNNEIIHLNTSLGDVYIELYWKHAPKTCRNFYELTKRGYYNNTKFHRLIKNFMIQGGDPSGTGKGGSSIYGPLFEDEIHSELRHVGAGILSMANSGPNTNNSQFFITLGPCQWIDGKNTIFGRVCKGIKSISKMATMPTDKDDRLKTDIYIIGACIINSKDVIN
uniref:Peptidyl-prolyl cis-trans isomerase n=1 Tax=Henneguya salminicola TaxID=69463 RepID=A0A6G3MK37_HENSL